MASLQKYNGRGKDAGKTFYRIQPYIGSKRVTFRLGTGQKNAEKCRKAIGDLIDSGKAGVEPAASTKAWLADNANESLCKALLESGLINELPNRFTNHEETSQTIELLCDSYIRQIGAGKEPSTITVYGLAKQTLIEFFGNKSVESVSFDDARNYWAWMIGKRKLAPNTAKQRLRYARSFFSLAVENDVLPKNPFTAKGLSVTQTAAQKTYVEAEAIEAIIEHCPTLEWKLFFKMARTIPMRIPSEIRELAWGDVDWEQNRILIHSPKTRHIGKDARLVPIFAEISDLLSDAYFGAGEEGEKYIFPSIRLLTNVGKLAGDIITRAKLPTWTNFGNSLRASAETDLMDNFGLRRACQWAGNSPATAMKNYALIRKQDFMDAGGQKVDAKCAAIPASTRKHRGQTNTVKPEGNEKGAIFPALKNTGETHLIGQAGLEPATKGL